MRTYRNTNTENPEQKNPHQLNHDKPDLRQPGMVGSKFLSLKELRLV